MKIKNITSQSRRDFYATYECEDCGHVTKEQSGYDDRNFHDNVIPSMKCVVCEKSRNDLNIVGEKTATKYQPWGNCIMKEYIMCSAIWVKDKEVDAVHIPKNIEYGAVYCGYRHCNCIELISHKYDRLKFIEIGNMQGFLTSQNRFVDRIEGMKIAKESGRLLKPQEVKKELYSEDLWLSNQGGLNG